MVPVLVFWLRVNMIIYFNLVEQSGSNREKLRVLSLPEGVLYFSHIYIYIYIYFILNFMVQLCRVWDSLPKFPPPVGSTL